MLTFNSIAKLIPVTTGTLFIGYSGGVDSHVLLHLLANQPNLRHKIVAIYINHGLQVEADFWALHCEYQCRNLGVAFRSLFVNAKAKIGESPEEVARNARYKAFQSLLNEGDTLLFAQHREDQLETVLLQMFRGAGLNGLAAMPADCRFGRGALIRPFLNISKSSILSYADYHQLSWVEDPSNDIDEFDRNFLRNEVIPLLKQRWPSIDKTVARSAQHCADSAGLINNWANSVIYKIVDPVNYCLLIQQWRLFDQSQRRYLLRYWLQMFGLKPPSQAVLQAIINQVIDARLDADPQLIIQKYQIRKYRDKLYCFPENSLFDYFKIGEWERGTLCYNLKNGFQLVLIEAQAGIPKLFWENSSITIDKRHGGERIQLPNRQGKHCLKKLYQESGIPPWERNKPLVFIDRELATVPGLWIDQRFLTSDIACYQVVLQKTSETMLV